MTVKAALTVSNYPLNRILNRFIFIGSTVIFVERTPTLMPHRFTLIRASTSSHSPHNNNSNNCNNNNNTKELSKGEKLKKAVKDYGSTVIVFHVSISLISLGFFYTLVSTGLDVVSLLSQLPYVGEQLTKSTIGTGASTFVIAYAVHKVFAPVRISITLTTVPFIVRYLRAKKILK